MNKVSKADCAREFLSGDYCDGSLPFYLVQGSIGCSGEGGLGSSTHPTLPSFTNQQLLLLRYCHLPVDANNASAAAAAAGEEAVAGARGQRAAQTAETRTVPLELVTKDRLSSSGKRVLMRSMLGQKSHLATGQVLSHCLSIETSGWVAGEGVLVWADYSGKITSNVSFTLTSPQGSGGIILLLILRPVYLSRSCNMSGE